MAQRKKRVTARKRKSTVRGRARKAAKRTTTKLQPKKGVARTKRPRPKKIARKRARLMKPPSTPLVETTIVDVIEEPAPGVITVTEFEETDIREAGAGQEPEES